MRVARQGAVAWRRSSIPILVWAVCCSPEFNEGRLAAVEVDQQSVARIEQQYLRDVQPLLARYCYECHTGEAAEGDVDAAKLATLDEMRSAEAQWTKMRAALEEGLMPPADAQQPLPVESQAIIEWIDRFLGLRAEQDAGDPGPVIIRRLNNVEYAQTIRALTGVATLDPAREFPPDGAAGEGFMNVGAALAMSPALADKYYGAAKEIAKHAVFTPRGMRFSTGETERDHTDEYIQRIREFYGRYAVEDASGLATSARAAHKSRAGIAPLERYITALLAEREPLRAGSKSVAEVAAAYSLNAKYLTALWAQLDSPSDDGNCLLVDVRRVWQTAKAGDAQRVVSRIRAWQQSLWKFNPIGRIGQKDAPKQWQEPVTPIVDRHELRAPIVVEDRSAEDVRVYLSAASRDGDRTTVVWQRPRLVRAGREDILIRDAWRLDALYRQERQTVFAQTAQCLEAAEEAFGAAEADNDAIAARYTISPIALAAWRQFLGEDGAGRFLGERINDRIEMISTFGFVKGWVTPDGASVLANSSDETARTPATYPPRSIVVHPSPSRRVLVAWRSPVRAAVRVSASVQDSHPGCGNGIEWSLELRRGQTKQVLWSGTSSGDALESLVYPHDLQVREGDGLVLAIGPRDGDHSCDSTDIHLDIESGDRRWSIADEAVSDILSQNPRGDRFGNPDVWHFATELTGDRSLSSIPADSILARWQLTPDRDQRRRLGAELAQLLAEQSPRDETDPNRQMRQVLMDDEEALLTALLSHAASIAAQQPSGEVESLGISPTLFGHTPAGEKIDQDSLGSTTGELLEIRLPAAVAAGSELAVEGTLPPSNGTDAAQFQILADKPDAITLVPTAPLVARSGSESHQRLMAMCEQFRQLFPIALCYLQVVPVDEVITMLLYYREDEHLCRLMLSDSEKAELDRLWDELLFVSREPEETLVAFDQLLEYATQIDPGRVKKLEPMRATLIERIEHFRARRRQAEPVQIAAVVDWAANAYRRPLSSAEKGALGALYRQLRDEDLPHEEALRLLIARVLISPNFLYRIEKPATGDASSPVDDWELASRLSYFLWSAPPDAELRRAAEAGALSNADALLAQTRRMLADDRVRSLAVEFGCQWLNIHNFAQLDEKNESLFPTFEAARGPMYEEAIRFFCDLFQHNRSVLDLIDADYAFLNEELAEHYGIPDVKGPQWRRVEGVRQYGRGGILGLGAVLAKQSGASRTSPVLRGNWLASVVLDDPLPPPPKDVPPLDDAVPEGLTERQITERHARDPACMSCHAHIDPFGFALEHYDAIGRHRAVDAAGLTINAKSTLPDGTVVEGIDGLRSYLLTQRREEFVRQFCSKLLGYGLGREVLHSDGSLIDQMTDALKAGDYKAARAVELVVGSKQFREIRSVDPASRSASRPPNP